MRGTTDSVVVLLVQGCRLGPRFLPAPLLAVTMMACGHGWVQSDAPAVAAKELPKEQKEKLKERDRLSAEAQKLEADGKLVEAIVAAEKMLVIERAVYGSLHEEVRTSLEWLARMHAHRGELATAAKTSAEQLAIAQKLYGREDWRLTRAQLDADHAEKLIRMAPKLRLEVQKADRSMIRARSHYNTGEFRQARDHFEKALEVRRQAFGADYWLCSQVLGWLGLVNNRLGDLDTAEKYYRQAVDKKAYGEKHPQYALDLQNLGWTYANMGKHAQAESLYRKALPLIKHAYGVRHAEYANALSNLGNAYRQLGRYAEAEPLLEQALALRKEVLGEKSLPYTWSLDMLGSLYRDQALYGKAEPFLQQMVEITKELLGERHPDYSHALHQLATLHVKTKNYRKAELLFRQVLEIDRRTLGENHPSYLTCLHNLAVLYGNTGNYGKEESLLRQILEIRKKDSGEKSPQYLTVLQNLGVVYGNKGENAKAAVIYEQVLKAEREIFGENSPRSIVTLTNLAFTSQELGDYEKSVSYQRQALAICKRAKHGDTPLMLHRLAERLDEQAWHYSRQDKFAAALKAEQESHDIYAALGEKFRWKAGDAALSLEYMKHLEQMPVVERQELRHADKQFNESHRLFQQGKYHEALPKVVQTIAIRKRLLGGNHWLLSTPLTNLGLLYRNLDELDKAEAAYKEATLVFGKSNRDHPYLAATFHNLARIYEQRGDLARARGVFQQALAQYRKGGMERSASYANTLNSIASCHAGLGDYGQAQAIYQEAIRLVKEAVGDRDAKYATSLLQFGGFYVFNLGDYDRALPLYRQAVAIYKDTLGESHPDYARALDYSGTLYTRREEYALAEPLYTKALAIRKGALGEKNREVSISLNNLGLLYSTTGTYDKAELFLQQSLAIDKQLFGEKHGSYAIGLSNLALLYDRMGAFTKAEPLYQQALAIWKETRGERHRQFIGAVHDLALHLARAGRKVESLELIRKALGENRRLYEETSRSLSERQQLIARRDLRYTFGLYLSLSAELKAPAEEVYSQMLFWKAPVTAQQSALRRLRKEVDRLGKTELKQIFQDLESSARLLAARSQATPDPRSPIPLAQELEELSDRVEQMQRRLMAGSGMLKRELQPPVAGTIRDALPEDVALIDYVEYERFHNVKTGRPKWPAHLAAFILRKGGPVERIELGPLEPISQAILAWRQGYGSTTGKNASPGAELRQRLWLPLEKHLGKARTILISPGGALAGLPFAALPGSKKGSFLIEERSVAAVPVARSLPEMLATQGDDAKSDIRSSLLLLGGVDFDAQAGKDESTAVARVAPRADRAGEFLHWGPLPGSQGEFKAVGDMFQRRYPKARIRALSGGKATEAEVRAKAPGSTFLHFATHGYFAPAKFHSALEASQRDLAGFHPGLLSGLVLAGANRPVEREQDDGILTALEVEALDLAGVELVVLSACETGLGKTAGGEGLLGLQRAFQVAGARSVVASLWQVPDRATQLLMQRFYRNLWNEKMTKLEALREAQLWLLREGRRQPDLLRGLQLVPEPRSDDGRLPPRYWAAFVLAGNWR